MVKERHTQQIKKFRSEKPGAKVRTLPYQLVCGVMGSTFIKSVLLKISIYNTYKICYNLYVKLKKFFENLC